MHKSVPRKFLIDYLTVGSNVSSVDNLNREKEKQMSTIIQTNKLTKSYGKSRGIIEVIVEIQEGDNGGRKVSYLRPDPNGWLRRYRSETLVFEPPRHSKARVRCGSWTCVMEYRLEAVEDGCRITLNTATSCSIALAGVVLERLGRAQAKSQAAESVDGLRAHFLGEERPGLHPIPERRWNGLLPDLVRLVRGMWPRRPSGL